MKHTINDDKGFTLIEVLITTAIFSVALTAIYSVNNSQISSQITQQRTVNMQQNIRAAIYMMEKDIIMAGHDPNGTSNATIINAASDQLQFSMDSTGGETDGIDNDNDISIDEADEDTFGDGDTNDSNEQIRYALTNDQNQDGIADDVPCHLGRATGGGGLQRLSSNIDAINFVYLNSAGTVLATPVANPDDIRTVQITIVAREGQNIPVMSYKTTCSKIYYNQQGQIIYSRATSPDGFRRIMLSANVYCRNMVHFK